jgi:uncharacterized membrane protein YecN with MAPEG domain
MQTLITPFYAALLALLFLVLSYRTIRLRRRLRVAIGDGHKPELQRAMRVHANFAEYVPLALLLIYFFEQQTGLALWTHILCVALLVGRALHAYGVSQAHEDFRFRVGGMFLTLSVIAAVSVTLIAGQLLRTTA